MNLPTSTLDDDSRAELMLKALTDAGETAWARSPLAEGIRDALDDHDLWLEFESDLSARIERQADLAFGVGYALGLAAGAATRGRPGDDEARRVAERVTAVVLGSTLPAGEAVVAVRGALASLMAPAK